jgi:chromosome segregation ATPase
VCNHCNWEERYLKYQEEAEAKIEAQKKWFENRIMNNHRDYINHTKELNDRISELEAEVKRLTDGAYEDGKTILQQIGHISELEKELQSTRTYNNKKSKEVDKHISELKAEISPVCPDCHYRGDRLQDRCAVCDWMYSKDKRISELEKYIKRSEGGMTAFGQDIRIAELEARMCEQNEYTLQLEAQIKEWRKRDDEHERDISKLEGEVARKDAEIASLKERLRV